MTVPDAPSLTVTAGNQSVNLSWTAPNDGGSPILEYQVYRGDISRQYSFVGVTKNLYFNDTHLAGGTNYYYVVVAVNAIGKGNYSTEKIATPFGLSGINEVSTITVTVTNTEIISSTSNTDTNSGTNTPGFEFFSFLILGIPVAFTIVNRKHK